MEAEIYDRYLIIAGFKNVRTEDIKTFFDLSKRTTDALVQFFDARLMAGFEHLYFAALNALKAFDAGVNISKNPAVEVLLFASGRDQIRKSIELLGIKPDSSEVAVLIMAETRLRAIDILNEVSSLLDGERCDDVINLTDEKTDVIKRTFGVSDLEIEAALRDKKSKREALVSLLIEHAALLVTQR